MTTTEWCFFSPETKRKNQFKKIYETIFSLIYNIVKNPKIPTRGRVVVVVVPLFATRKMGRDEFEHLAGDADIREEGGSKTSPAVIAYTIVVTVLFIAAAVLLGIVYFDLLDDDDDSSNGTVTALTEFVKMEDPAFSTDWDFDPIVGDVRGRGEKGREGEEKGRDFKFFDSLFFLSFPPPFSP